MDSGTQRTKPASDDEIFHSIGKRNLLYAHASIDPSNRTYNRRDGGRDEDTNQAYDRVEAQQDTKKKAWQEQWTKINQSTILNTHIQEGTATVKQALKTLAVSRGGRNPGLGMPFPSEHEGAMGWTPEVLDHALPSIPRSRTLARLEACRTSVPWLLPGEGRGRLVLPDWAFAKYATVIGSGVNRAVSLEHSMRCVRESYAGQACRPLKTPF
jgi:hypothetical protein